VLAREELAQRHGLAAQALGVLVVGEEVAELVSDGGDAARIQPDDRHPGDDVVLQLVQDLAKERLGLVEEPVVVKRLFALKWGV